jgi:hypothetical protein
MVRSRRLHTMYDPPGRIDLLAFLRLLSLKAISLTMFPSASTLDDVYARRGCDEFYDTYCSLFRFSDLDQQAITTYDIFARHTNVPKLHQPLASQADSPSHLRVLSSSFHLQQSYSPAILLDIPTALFLSSRSTSLHLILIS